VDVLADKKAEDITLLDISELTLLTDYFIICTGTSERQLQARASSVREELKKAQRVIPLSVEGQVSSGWVLMDYGSVVVHLFAPEIRAFYDLEDLWREGRVVVRIQ
jgi:ribosome-associated protein